jgi:hypothetical protein
MSGLAALEPFAEEEANIAACIDNRKGHSSGYD